MRHDILLLDNNAVRKLADPERRSVLRSNLAATGRDFWPSAVNVLEAMKSRRPHIRERHLKVLGDLAGENHVLTLPTEALKRLATAMAHGSSDVDLSEPSLTAFIRAPDEVAEEDAAEARRYLIEQEDAFRRVHEDGQKRLRPVLMEEGGVETWPTLESFLDGVWTVPSHLNDYAESLWEQWELPGTAPLEGLLGHPAWRLYFDGWGTAAYSKNVAHPQPPWVETADFQQLVYMGFARSALLVSDDGGLQLMGNLILQCHLPGNAVTSVASVTE